MRKMKARSLPELVRLAARLGVTPALRDRLAARTLHELFPEAFGVAHCDYRRRLKHVPGTLCDLTCELVGKSRPTCCRVHQVVAPTRKLLLERTDHLSTLD